jgi:hypothetical protein
VRTRDRARSVAAHRPMSHPAAPAPCPAAPGPSRGTRSPRTRRACPHACVPTGPGSRTADRRTSRADRRPPR